MGQIILAGLYKLFDHHLIPSNSTFILHMEQRLILTISPFPNDSKLNRVEYDAVDVVYDMFPIIISFWF